MRKKKMVLFLTGILLASILVVPGCKLDDSQIKTIAQQTGLFAAVGWIAADNPTPEEVAAVRNILSTILDKSGDVVAGKTYTEVIYPTLEQVINDTMEQQYRPLAKAAGLSLLGAIDMMFALHPEWRENQDTAIAVVKSFILGAQQGFSLEATHPAMVQARKTAGLRAKVKQ
jgi:hypothetical protein